MLFQHLPSDHAHKGQPGCQSEVLGRIRNWLQWNGIETSVRELVSKVETVDFAATPKGGEPADEPNRQSRSLVAVSNPLRNHERHKPDNLVVPPSDAVNACRN